MKNYLGIDLRPQQVALVRGRLEGRNLVYEKCGAYKRAPNDWDVVVRAAQEFDHASALVIVSIDAQEIASQGEAIPPYIEPRDIAAFAELSGQRNAVRPERPRRIRFSRIDQRHLSISIANDNAVSELALAFEDRGIMLHAMVDPSFAWLNSFAPCGIIDDAGGTTMIVYPSPEGTPVMDVVRRDVSQRAFIQQVIKSLGRRPHSAQYDHLMYFGDSSSPRYIDLRQAILGYNKELYPITPPGKETLEPWAFAAALAYSGAAHL